MEFVAYTLLYICVLYFPRVSAASQCNNSSTDALQELAHAPGVVATLSSQHDSAAKFGPQKAIDGIYVPVLTGIERSEEHISIAHTRKERSPWIQFDLKQTRCISGVLIWNRSNWSPGVTNRFRHGLISVADSPAVTGFGTKNSPTKCAFHAGLQNALRFYQCEMPMSGRYVRITGLNQNNWLNLYEVEIYGF